MNDGDDEAELLRIRGDELEAAAARPPTSELGAVVIVGITKTVTTYPTAAGSFFAVEAQAIYGAEIEGGAGTLIDLGDTFYAYNIGATKPDSGTKVLCFGVPQRMVMQYD